MPSRETAFLAIYPALRRVIEKGGQLRAALEECVESEWGPDTDDIPVLLEASDGLAIALDDRDIRELGPQAFTPAFLKAMSVVRTSIAESNDGLLWDAIHPANEGCNELDGYVHLLAVGAFGEWGAYFFSLCEADLPDECFDHNEFSPELLVAGSPAGDLLIFTPLQKSIMKALDGKALKKQALANEICKGEGRVLYRPGGLQELRRHGLVEHRPQIGFYRPDSPPPDSIALG